MNRPPNSAPETSTAARSGSVAPRAASPAPAAGRGQGEGARLKEPPAPELVRSSYRKEIGEADVLMPGLELADLAHVVMLRETGIVDPGDGARLLGLLLELGQTPAVEFPLDPALEDVYSNREAWLRARDPRAAGWLGAGRPRREPAVVAHRIATRERVLGLFAATLRLVEALLAQARDHADTVMPDYTYLQRAHPTSLAHYLLSFAFPLTRDLDRLRTCFGRVNLCPAGIGNINGSRLPLDRERLSRLLGFDAPITNTRDAMWQTDVPLETISAAVALLLHADRLAEDLQIWNTAEFDLVELADRHARISMIMPQKKNPYSLAYVRGVAGDLLGRLVSIAAVGKTPSGQMDNRVFVVGELPRALDEATGAVELLAGVVGGLRFDTALMRERAGCGFTNTTDLCELLMRDGDVDYRTAHRIVGLAVRKTVDGARSTASVPFDVLQEAASETIGRPLRVDPGEVASLDDPAAIVATRTGLGGAARAPVDAMAEEISGLLAAGAEWHSGTCARLDAALAELRRIATGTSTQDRGETS